MFFLFVLQEPPLPQLSMSRCVELLPSGVSLKPLCSTCCSQINEKDALPWQWAFLSMPHIDWSSLHTAEAAGEVCSFSALWLIVPIYENCTAAMHDGSCTEHTLPRGRLNRGVSTSLLVSTISHPMNIWPWRNNSCIFFYTLKLLSMNEIWRDFISASGSICGEGWMENFYRSLGVLLL